MIFKSASQIRFSATIMFYEYSAFELPSKASSHPNIAAKNNNNHENINSAARLHRLSTEYHSVGITVDEDSKMNITTQSLHDFDNIPIGKCVGHSFFPLDQCDSDGKKFYLEALIIKLHEDEVNIERSTHTLATTSSDIRNKDTLTKNSSAASLITSAEGKCMNNPSCHGGISQIDEKKADDSLSVKAGEQDEYCILIRGVLPNLNQKYSSQHPLDEHVQCSDNGEQSSSMTYALDADVQQNTKRTRESDWFNFNVYQQFPVPYRPTTIELCPYAPAFGENSCSSEEFMIFVAHDAEVKIYAMSLSNLQKPLSNGALNGLQFEERTLVPIEDMKKSEVQQNMDFMSSLHQEVSDSSVTESSLTFTSHITAMTCMSTGALYHLAVACKDGTIRVISFSLNNGNTHDPDGTKSYSIVAESEFCVDGPILSLAFSCDSEYSNDTKIKLLAGSINGFACYFLQMSDDQGFNGPFPIIEGLWNAKLSEEDAILCICEFQYGGVHNGRVVALGLFSGRVLLLGSNSTPFKRDDDRYPAIEQTSPHFNCVWHCSLPHAVKGITVAQSGMFSDLIICTKKSLHLFHSKPEDIAESTFERVEAILGYLKTENTII